MEGHHIQIIQMFVMHILKGPSLEKLIRACRDLLPIDWYDTCDTLVIKWQMNKKY